MELHILIQGINDPPRLLNIPQPIIDLSENPSITMCLVEKGMVSGEPSVLIVSSDNEGSVVLQTSLDKLLAGASTLASSAEFHWGWVRPEGHVTLMPPNKETRKMLLEAMIKELKEYDD